MGLDVFIAAAAVILALGGPLIIGNLARGGRVRGAHLEGSCSMADTRHIAVVAPHFEEYALGLANGLACERKVALFVEKSLLETEFIGRDMPVSPNLAVKDLRFSSPFGAISALIDLVKFRPSVIHVQEASGLLRALTCAWIVAMTRRCCRIALTVHDPMPHVGRDEDIAKRLRYPANSSGEWRTWFSCTDGIATSNMSLLTRQESRRSS